jgi:pimeloyl-ACP methyl ester carboxylesterase
LHTLLVNAGIEAPYVLVGHQIGGDNAIVFAHEYADKVAGIVLADSNPTEWERFEKHLPAHLVPAIPPSLEGIDVLKSAAQARGSGDLGDKPLVVLTGDHGHTFMWEGLSEDILLQIERTYLDMQEELAGLSSNGTYIRVEGGWRHVYESHPERVVDAIQAVVDAVRGE